MTRCLVLGEGGEPTPRLLDALDALHPLPRAVARELATVPGLWVSQLAARFPEEAPAAVRLAIATLVDTDVAWLPLDGRIALRGWAREALRGTDWLDDVGKDEPLPVTVTEAGLAALARSSR